jgi:predicted Zn-dependent protease
MAEVLPLPSPGDVFADVRGEDRTMRVSYHQDSGIVVVSLWDGRTCRASFRLPSKDVARLAAVLAVVQATQPEPEAEADPEKPNGDSEPEAQAS